MTLIKKDYEKALIFGALSFVGGLIARKIYEANFGDGDNGNI